ncbi:MAG: nicotinamide-nucleotide amidase [Alphaproteobacteria bacterium]|jgi:nicotinamide-nucleotide amidase
MFSENILHLAEKAIKQATDAGITISTAESCTGGLVIAALTEVSGSSTVVNRGFITYTNQAKMDMVAVKAETLEKYGAVSAQTVNEMAIGAREKSGSDIAVSVSGIAGPMGGSAEKPVGLVHFALADKNGITLQKTIFKGDRQSVRMQTVEAVLKMILKNIL